MKARTTLGHKVFALRRWKDPKTLAPTWTGKIRIDENNPGKDQYLDWYREPYRNGIAIGHNMGDLILKEGV